MAQEKSAAGRGLTEAGSPAIIVFPACAPGEGLGHIRRAVQVVQAAGGRGFLFLGKRARKDRPELRSLLDGLDPARVISDPAAIPAASLAVFDSRRTEAALQAALARRVFTVGLDEGGAGRAQFHFLIDTLPMIASREPANTRALPVRRPDVPDRAGTVSFRRVLVSMGGEDAADLSGRILALLLGAGGFAPQALTVIQGPLFGRRQWPEGVNVIRNCPGVESVIDGFDLLVTHFGLSAYEALLRGVPVILCNPTAYHRRLSRADGLPEIGVGRPHPGRLAYWLKRPEALRAALTRFQGRKQGLDVFSERIIRLVPQGCPVCPVCGRAGGRALERFPQKTYFRCAGCGILRLVFWGAKKTYAGDYFGAEYRRQYGRSYLEDFDHIRTLGLGRLDRMAAVLRRRRPAVRLEGLSLLDVGAAYGPFLAAASSRGLTVTGFDIAAAAAAYVREQLGLACLEGDFMTEPIGVRLREKSFDIISMWYVLEHFTRVGDVLRKVNRLLKPGGLLALGTPSQAGISRRRNRRAFLEQSPADHFTIWSPGTASRALGRFGFRVMLSRVTGHHPERFGLGRGGKVLEAVSRLCGLGDTFEAYAVKERDCD